MPTGMPIKLPDIMTAKVLYLMCFISEKILNKATVRPAIPTKDIAVFMSKPIKANKGMLIKASPKPKYVRTKAPKNIANKIKIKIVISIRCPPR